MMITPTAFFIGLAVFILSFMLAYAFLTKTGLVANNIAAVVSFIGALFLAFNPALRTFVYLATPWFVIMSLIIFLLLFVFSTFGAEIPLENLMKNGGIIFVVIFLSIIIIIVSFTQVYGERVQDKPPLANTNGTYYNSNYNPNIGVNPAAGISPQNDFNTNLVNTLLHPKMIGMFILFLIAIFAVAFLTKPAA